MFNQNLFANVDQKLVTKFMKFHAANPDVYLEFGTLAQQMRDTGKTKYSAWSIINIIRWNKDLLTVNDVFEINNDFIALYARLFMDENPDFENFFNIRKMKPSNRLVSSEEYARQGNENAY